MTLNEKTLKTILFLAGIALVLIISSLISPAELVKPSLNTFSLGLSSDKMILITSAGQSTDTYILQDIANELRLHNLFMPQATTIDTETVSSIVMVVGNSQVGLNLHDKTFAEEYKRIKDLITAAKTSKIPLIAVFIGGKERRDANTDQLIKLICPESNYIVTTYAGNYDHLLSKMAEKNDTPISVINTVMDLTEPLASVYR